MFSNLIRGLLGAFGIIKKTRKFSTEHNAEFLQSLAAGTVVLTWSRNPDFLQGGIQGATNSIIQHALLYVGRSAAEKFRRDHPEICESRRKIPAGAVYHEIVEAQGEGVIVSNLDKNLGDNTQMVAYSRQLTEEELDQILMRVYSCVGTPYDVAEFIGHILPVGNPKNLFVCSSLVAHGYQPIEVIVKSGVDYRKATPRDLNDYLAPNLSWQQTRYNW